MGSIRLLPALALMSSDERCSVVSSIPSRASRTVKSTLSTRPPTPAVSVTVTVESSEPKQYVSAIGHTHRIFSGSGATVMESAAVAGLGLGAGLVGLLSKYSHPGRTAAKARAEMKAVSLFISRCSLEPRAGEVRRATFPATRLDRCDAAHMGHGGS